MAFIAYNSGIGGISTDTPQEALRELLIKKTRAAGHKLTFDEAKSDPTMVDPNTYAFYFGRCFSDISESVWLTINRPTMKIIKRKGTNNMKRSIYDAEKVKASLRTFFTKHHRWPTQSEANVLDELPAYGTILKYCGNKSDWDRLILGGDTDGGYSPAIQTPESSSDAGDDVTHDVAPTQDRYIVSVKDASSGSAGAPIAELAMEESSDHRVNIELKIILPDREKPIMFNLSF